MLTQGVTTEIVNADGSGPVDIGAQLSRLSSAGLAVNVGAYAGFNTAWASVAGNSRRRATDDEISVVSVATGWRTNFPNHERLTP